MTLKHISEFLPKDKVLDIKTKQKLEAIIRADVDNIPWKFRDLHSLFFDGILPYKNLSKDEIEQTFLDLGLVITEQDIEWSTYNK